MKTKQGETNYKKNECNICNKVIIGSSYKFRSHLYQHSAVKSRFKCSHCSKEYFRRDAYDKHMAVHTGARKYHICDYCDRGFVDKRNLTSHLKIHDEYFHKPKEQYKCYVCGISYCEERLLKYHIRKQHFNLHAKESALDKKKPNETWVERVIQSEICVEMTKVNESTIMIKKSPKTVPFTQNKQASEKTKFREYISSVFAKTDKSQYSKAVCDYCNKEMLKKSLQSHIRERHLLLKRFKCEECNIKFSRHYQLVNHVCGKPYRKRLNKSKTS
ncbi:unnamed protein product [Arctia plantaginis]|uniref:C2H2-type domain-containing protein n=1 Tax=Arctia plantaginis TaxID=874455 RepID=A0A8S1BGA5_ARCPL|nr:unnamed protein product [Arctia plantaginis]